MKPIELLKALVSIDNVNPALVENARGEAEIVAYLQELLVGAGFATRVVINLGRPSLLALGPEVAGPTVLLNGHLDTVGVSGMAAPFTPEIVGDKLFGRGAADMKGGVAAMVAAALELVEAGANVRPILALVADEEDLSLGSVAVIQELKELGEVIDLCVIGEPTHLATTRSLRGFAVIEVTFAGLASHSSEPENGVSALNAMVEFVTAVNGERARIQAGGGDFMVTVASAGSSPFVIPDAARCVVERRTVAGEDIAQALAEVEALIKPEWQAQAVLVNSRDSWMQDTSGPAATFASALDRQLGGGEFDAPYWMEAPLWQEIAPTVVCGPSGGGLHAVDEFVSISQVESFAKALVAAAKAI